MTGSVLQAYMICKRQAWLLAHQITGESDNDLLVIGRLIAQDSYSKDKKELKIFDGIVDVVRNEKGKIKIIEVKKSSKSLESAKYQLLFYMWKLSAREGEIRIPKEKKIVKVFLTNENEKKLLLLLEEAEKVINNKVPPEPVQKSYCKTCSYNLFCWS